MSQISMLDRSHALLETQEDICALLETIREGETDNDLFSYKEISGGRSYSFYGTKVFEFYPSDGKNGAKIKVSKEVLAILGYKVTQPFSLYTVETTDDLTLLTQALREWKKRLFRNLVTDRFACCNDFNRCSEAKACIHQDDRFYNGCTYRQNLEQGRIFYGPNRNVD